MIDPDSEVKSYRGGFSSRSRGMGKSRGGGINGAGPAAGCSDAANRSVSTTEYSIKADKVEKNYKEAPENFELDKLHIQQVEPSSTEEEFSAFVETKSGVKPESTQFVHREGINWHFCFQKFKNDEDAETALFALKNCEFKGMQLKVMHARRKKAMNLFKQSKLQQHPNQKTSYGEYYQESYQYSLGRGGNPYSYSSRRGGGFASNRAPLSTGAPPHSYAKNHYYQNGEPATASHRIQNKNRTEYVSQNGAMGRGSKRTNQTNPGSPMYTNSVHSRLGPKVEGDQDMKPSSANSQFVYSARKDGQSCVKKDEPFIPTYSIDDLQFVDVRKPFAAFCLQIHSHKNLVLQVVSLSDGRSVYNKQTNIDMHQNFAMVGSSLGNLECFNLGTVCLAETENEEMPFRRAIILSTEDLVDNSISFNSANNMCSGDEGNNHSPPRRPKFEGEVEVELVDYAEIIKVDCCKLFNISRECLSYEVSRFHGCFSNFDLAPDEASEGTVMGLLKESLLEPEQESGTVAEGEDENGYFDFVCQRRVFNWLDIEVLLGGAQELNDTLTKHLYQTNAIILTEASMEWKRYTRLEPIQLKDNREYSGTITHVNSPKDFYVQIDSFESKQQSSSGKDQTIKSDCERLRQDQIRSLIFDTLPRFEMPEIPNYKPFPFELVCVKIDDLWYRANICQLITAASDTTLPLSSESGSSEATEATSQKQLSSDLCTKAKVHLVDHGYDMIVDMCNIKPVYRDFILINEAKSPRSDISVSDANATKILGQAVNVALPNTPAMKFTDTAIQSFMTEFLLAKVKLNLVSSPRKHSNDANICDVNWVTIEEEGSTCEYDLTALCFEKGIITTSMYPVDGQTDASVIVKKEPIGENGDGDERRAYIFEEDESFTQISGSSDQHQTASELHVLLETVQEENRNLNDRVCQLEKEIAEMKKFKITVEVQLNKLKNVFGSS